MKNIKFLSLIALVLLIAGCSLDVTPDQYEPAENETGKSKVTVNIGGNARTILPVLDYDNFDKYTIEAAKGSDKVGPFDMHYGTYTLLLDPGTWTVTVKAFFIGVVDNAGKPLAVAKGSIDITVADADIDATVFINIPESGGLGTFNYTILPENAAGVSVKLFAFNFGTKTFADAPAHTYDDISGAKELASGIYLLSVEAKGKTEVDVVHIYNGQTSYATFDFDAEVLGVYGANHVNDYTDLYSLQQYQIVNVDGRENVLMVSNVTEYAAAVYGRIYEYYGADVTIHFSAEVKRVGAAGALIWRINGSGYPQMSGAINNAAEGEWHSMTGAWSGTNSGTFLYLDANQNNSENTTYYIANFEATITLAETSSLPEDYDYDEDITKYDLPWSYHDGSFYVLDNGVPTEMLHSPLIRAGSPVIISKFWGLNVTGRTNTWDGLDINVTGATSSLSANPDGAWGFGIDTATNNYKVTVSGNALGVVPAGAKMQMQAITPNPQAYGATITGDIAEDKTFTLVWNINETFTHERLRIQTNEAAKAMPFRINQIIVEDMGERVEVPTSINITVGGAAQDVTITGVNGTVEILQDGSGYSFSRSADWENSYTWFKLNIGSDPVAQFDTVKFTYKGISGDTTYKNPVLVASSTSGNVGGSGTIVTNGTVSNAPQVAGAVGTAYPNVTFDIDETKTNAALTGEVFFSINVNGNGTQVIEISNIVFTKGVPCGVCGQYICICYTAVTGVPVMQTLGYENVPIYLPAQALPVNATQKTIAWSVVSGSATLAGNVLTPTGAGSVVLKATVTNGLTASTDYVKADITITISAVPAPVGELNITNFTTLAGGYGSTNIGGNTWKQGGNYQRAIFAIGQSVTSAAYESVTITYTADYQVRFGFYDGSALVGDWTYLATNTSTRTISIPSGATITGIVFDSTAPSGTDTLLTIVRVSFKEVVGGGEPEKVVFNINDFAGKVDSSGTNYIAQIGINKQTGTWELNGSALNWTAGQYQALSIMTGKGGKIPSGNDYYTGDSGAFAPSAAGNSYKIIINVSAAEAGQIRVKTNNSDSSPGTASYNVTTTAQNIEHTFTLNTHNIIIDNPGSGSMTYTINSIKIVELESSVGGEFVPWTGGSAWGIPNTGIIDASTKPASGNSNNIWNWEDADAGYIKGQLKPDLSAAIKALTGGRVTIYWEGTAGGGNLDASGNAGNFNADSNGSGSKVYMINDIVLSNDGRIEPNSWGGALITKLLIEVFE